MIDQLRTGVQKVMNNYEIEIQHGMGELGKSRSQKKRESTALQKMGEALAELSASTLGELGLSGDLSAAINDLRSIKKHEARRRQMQLIGRCMRELDEGEQERISAFLESLDKQRQSESGELHRIEEWRDALLDEERREAMLELVRAEYPDAEQKKLRHLAESAAAERKGGKGMKSYRELFRYLKSL